MESTTYAKVVRLETNFWKCFAPDGKTREKEMQKTLLAGLEEAVDKLGPLRKAAWKRRLKNSAARQRALEELAEDFRGSDCCAEMQLQAAFDGPQFTAETPLEIDLDKWTKIVEWIMQWLPKIVDMIRKWFNIAILFALFGLLPSTAMAQDCYLDARGNQICPLRKAARAAAMPVVGVIHAVTAPRVFVAESVTIPAQITASCSGAVAAPSMSASCAGVATVRVVRGVRARILQRSLLRAMAPAPAQTAASCGGQQIAPSAAPAPSSPTTTRSSAYETALASAQFRAANGIHGHSFIDASRTSGVGWASHDPMPATCLGRGGSNYAVVRGRDGWYSSKIK